MIRAEAGEGYAFFYLPNANKVPSTITCLVFHIRGRQFARTGYHIIARTATSGGPILFQPYQIQAGRQQQELIISDLPPL